MKKSKGVLPAVGKILLVLLGNTLYALAIALFVLPSGLITGGTTGLGLVAQHLLGLPLSGFVGIFNAAMFVVGLCLLGKVFALTTALSSFYFPLVLELFQRQFQGVRLTSDPLLAAVCSGLMIGVGIGVVIRAGASTGGMDIPPLVLQKKFRVPVSISMYAFDCMILLLQALFSQTEQILYGLMLVLVYTLTLNKVMMLGAGQTQLKVVSKRYQEISQAILDQVDRGTTLLKSRGGFGQEEGYTVLTVVSARELPRLTRLVTAIDPEAFMVVSQVNEVRGRGFTRPKRGGHQPSGLGFPLDSPLTPMQLTARWGKLFSPISCRVMPYRSICCWRRVLFPLTTRSQSLS